MLDRLFFPLLLLAAQILATTTHASDFAKVKDLAFTQCLQYVMDDRTPFQNYELTAISENGLRLIPAEEQSRLAVHHILSEFYIVAWGVNSDEQKMCAVFLNLLIEDTEGSAGNIAIVSQYNDFQTQMDAVARASGLTGHQLPSEFDPYKDVLVWKTKNCQADKAVTLVVAAGASVPNAPDDTSQSVLNSIIAIDETKSN